MAKGISRGNKRVYNFSLDQIEDEKLIEWLEDQPVSKIVRHALKQHTINSGLGFYEDEPTGVATHTPKNNQNNDLNEQISQLTQLVQLSIASNQQMMNNILISMQNSNFNPIQPTQTTTPQMVEMLASFMAQQQQQQNQSQKDEQVAALEEGVEEQFSSEAMSYSEEEAKRLNNADDPLGAFEDC